MKKLFTSFCGRAAKIALVACALVTLGGSSAWADAKLLPYSYGFENNDLSGEGWTIVDGANGGFTYNTTAIYQNSYNKPRTGDYEFLFYAKNSAQYLISPELTNSATGIEVSLYYNAYASTSGTRNLSIGYSTTNTETSSFTFTDYNLAVTNDKLWYLNTTSFPNGTKYVAIKYNSNVNFYIDDITIEAQEAYKKPSNFTVSATTSTTATLSWTAGRDETAWQIAYSAKEDFTPDTEGAKVAVTENQNPYTLSGLTEGVTYYAYIRANYNGNFSGWSNKVEITPYMDVTINDGNSTNNYVPIYGYKANYDFKSQIIIPKASLEDNDGHNIIAGRNITQFTLYASQSSVNWGNARYNVYLNEVENTTYASTPVFESWGTKVCSNAEFSISGNKMVVVFDTPYKYNGGNLMVGFESSSTGSSGTSNWYGVNGTNNAAYYYYLTSYTTARTGFLPKITFRALTSTLPATIGANGFTTYASPRALDLANLPSGLKAYKAAVEGTTVKFIEIGQAVPANTGMLLEGVAGETYNIPVADSGTPLQNNDFFVNSTGGTFTADANTTYYGLIKDSNPLVFGTFDPETVAIPTNKAYLKVANPDGGGGLLSRLTCVFGDDTEGIQGVEQETLNAEIYYNLAGQRVDKPSKGLYIVNGKKLIIK